LSVQNSQGQSGRELQTVSSPEVIVAPLSN
jgi:hypothetical protein